MTGSPRGTSGEGAASATALHQVRPEWLALHAEPAIDPALPIIDAHHHLWDVGGDAYLLDDYLADLRSGHDVVASIYVQSGTMMLRDGPEALRPVGETRFATSVAARCEAEGSWPRVAAAIVGPFDLSLGTRAGAVLEAHAEAAGGRLRGVRALTHWHEDRAIHRIATTAGMLLTPSASEAIAAVERSGLVLDIWVYHTQLDEVIAVARAFPDLVIVLDHAGTPLGIGCFAGRRDEVLAAWRARMRVLAQLPNVFVKLGGLAMRFSGHDFGHRTTPPSSEVLAEAWRPEIETCIDLFGAGRCMFESNFPVDKASCAYGVLWNAFKRLCVGASQEERSRLFAGTAAAVYRIPLQGGGPAGARSGGCG